MTSTHSAACADGLRQTMMASEVVTNSGEGCTGSGGRGRRQTAMASEAATTEIDSFEGSDDRWHDLRQTLRNSQRW
ncbi:hypothetical protein Syun_014146 [Stephania yunnanensis]|uniref:Uncharacterized protein n=1 Tax=Stephania yunnanensis TaxID=152371 RepID=A0AAP0PBL9_9MAGN